MSPITNDSAGPEEKNKTPLSKYIFLLALFVPTVLAFALRTTYIKETVIVNPICADARQYVIYAVNLINHGTFSQEYLVENPQPDSFRSPGYPAFISIILLLSGNRYYQAVLTSQAFLSSLMVLLTFLLGASFLPSWAAMTAACAVACSPHLVSSASYILTETLFGFVLLLALFTFRCALCKNNAWIFSLAGVLFGYAYLVNEASLFLPWVLTITAVYLQVPLKSGLGLKKFFSVPIVKGSVVLLIVFSVFFVSWSVRNYINVPPGPRSGKQRALNTLTHGTYPGFIYKDPRFKYFPYREDPEQPEYSRSISNFARIFLKRFRERPLRYISWYLFEKPYYLWSWDILQGQGDIYIYPVKRSLYQSSAVANFTRKFMKFLHPFILLMALGGFLIAVRRWGSSKNPPVMEGHLVIYIPILYFTCLYTVFAPWPRYSIPLRPELYLAVMWTLTTLIDLLRKKISDSKRVLRR